MIPGLIVLIRAPRFPQRTASAMTRSAFARFERIVHLIRLQHLKPEQVVRPCHCQGSVLLRSQRWKAVPGLRRDDNARSTTSDGVAEFLQHKGCTVEVHLQYDGGDACVGETPAA